MELREVMENRRSIRAYKDTDIANEVVEDLIYHARLAPSAKNRQPWEFVIVKDEAKERITEIMLENLKEVSPELTWLPNQLTKKLNVLTARLEQEKGIRYRCSRNKERRLLTFERIPSEPK